MVTKIVFSKLGIRRPKKTVGIVCHVIKSLNPPLRSGKSGHGGARKKRNHGNAGYSTLWPGLIFGHPHVLFRYSDLPRISGEPCTSNATNANAVEISTM